AQTLRDAPGAAVSGKTGTAEYGSQQPPRSHSWFVGVQGDLAFAVLVLDGGNNGSKALQVTERFLHAL
ncbi:penicillin-binding transpeptidase domain-containing protein, partial [Escherichia coli]|uniref:penicillin-binding transpeptidase domain-containing protein n=1 Tax=Escherichia coli TaxID=562 RepID=UPI0033451438